MYENKKRYSDFLLLLISCLIYFICSSYARKTNNEIVFPGLQNLITPLPSKGRQHFLLNSSPLSLLLLRVLERMLRRFRMNLGELVYVTCSNSRTQSFLCEGLCFVFDVACEACNAGNSSWPLTQNVIQTCLWLLATPHKRLFFTS